MIETPNSDVDVNELMAELRSELAADPATATPAPHPTRPAATDLRWLEFLSAAERHAAVGGEVPPFNRYGPIRRRLARLVARPILYVAELVTHPQRTFNTMVLAALRQLGDQLRTLEQEMAAQRAQRVASVATRPEDRPAAVEPAPGHARTGSPPGPAADDAGG